MSEIDPVEFGKLCANAENTHNMVKEMHAKVEQHDDDIIALQGHNNLIKRAVKWIGSGIAAVFGFVMWVME